MVTPLEDGHATVDSRPSLFRGETQRLLALTDGVFSIVMTLLVFNLALPKDRPEVGLIRVLGELWPNFAAYGISVGLVGIYWNAHQGMFRFIVRTSLELNWLNLVFLAFLSLLPFSTSVLAGHSSDPIGLAIYGGNLLLIGLSLVPIWRHSTKGRRLVPQSMTSAEVAFGYTRILGGVVAYGLATAMAFVDTGLALALLAAVPLVYIFPAVTRVWSRFHGINPSR